MTHIDEQILIAGGVLLVAVASAVATRRARFPLLITFLGLGMLLGSEGVGGIYFDDAAARPLDRHRRPDRNPLRGRADDGVARRRAP